MPPKDAGSWPTQDWQNGVGALRSDSNKNLATIQELGQGQIVAQEGDEEVMYVYCNLEGLPSTSSVVNASVTLQGLDSATPQLQLSDGTTLQGEYADTLGSQLFFAADAQGQYSYIAQSEKAIHFRALPSRPPAAGGA